MSTSRNAPNGMRTEKGSPLPMRGAGNSACAKNGGVLPAQHDHGRASHSHGEHVTTQSTAVCGVATRNTSERTDDFQLKRRRHG